MAELLPENVIKQRHAKLACMDCPVAVPLCLAILWPHIV